MQNWDAAMEDLTRLKETIDNNVSYIFPGLFSEIFVYPSYFLIRKKLFTFFKKGGAGEGGMKGKERGMGGGGKETKMFRLAFVDLT